MRAKGGHPMNVRLSGSINGGQHKTWEGGKQQILSQNSSLRNNGSRSKLGTSANQATALQKYEAKIMQTKQ